MENKPKKSIIERLKSNKILEYVFLAVLGVAVIAIFFVSISGGKSEEVFSIDEYVKNLEQRLSTTLSKVEKAGKVSVFITVESGMQTVIAEQTETVTTKDEQTVISTPVMVNGDTVVLKTAYPNICGVLVVAEGANSLSVKNKLLNATASVLDISTDKIEILTMK